MATMFAAPGAAASAIVLVAVISVLSACGSTPRTRPSDLNLPASERVELPDVLGVPIVVVAPELRASALAEDERAAIEIEFDVDLQGKVSQSRVAATTHPALAESIRQQHAGWLYSVAVRDDPCAATAYRGRQRLDIVRRDGALQLALQPAAVIEQRRTVAERRIDQHQEQMMVPNYRRVMSEIAYPRAAMLAGVQAEFALLVEFNADGRVVDAFPVNSAYDRWGFAQTAVRAVRRLEADPAQSPFRACIPMSFRLR